MQLRPRASLILLTACLFLSGAAGLACEIVLTRFLGLFLGHASHAVIAVLVAFMGGLMIGNPVFGRLADRHPDRASRIYALLEFGIALYACLFLAGWHFMQSLFFGLARALPASTSLLFLLQFATALAIVLPPAILMGGTLPAVARFATQRIDELDRSVARLYLINSLGGSVGCLLAGFWWLPGWGLGGALGIAAGLNALAGTLVWVLPGRLLPTAVQAAPIAETRVAATRPTRADIRLITAVIALAGFAGMLYEIAWTRLLALVLGSTTGAFVLMLAAFVGGIAAGAGLVATLNTKAGKMDLLAGVELGLAVLVALSLPFYPWLTYGFARIAGWFAPDPSGYPLYAGLQAFVCLVVMFLPAMFLGAALPLACGAIARRSNETGGTVGTILAANTAGAVAGTLVAGLWLLPAIGLPRTFGVAIAVNAFIGALILLRRRARFRVYATFLVPALFVLVPWFAGPTFGDQWERALTLGLWRQPRALASSAEFREVMKENNLKYYRDGATATVSVNSWTSDGVEHLNLRINGKPDASTAGDLPTQLLLGHLPLLLRPQSQRALVIGLGSGITSGAVARHSSIQRLDTVEISPEVAQAARLFAAANHHVLDDPRFHLVVDDARSFLQITTNKYDVIISEPSNPWISGVAGVFTREFYECCRSHLPPDGLMVQWVHLYDNSQEALDLVLRTFSSIFPNVSVWQSEEYDLIFVGSFKEQHPDLDRLLTRLAEPEVNADLGRAFLNRAPVLLSRELIPAGEGRFLADSPGPMETDLKPRLEYLAQRALFAQRNATNWLTLDRNLAPRAETLLGTFLKSHPLAREDYLTFAAFQRTYRLPGPQLMRSLCLRWQSDPTARSALLEELPRLPPLGTLDETEALRLTPLRESLLQPGNGNIALLRHYADLLMRTYRSQRSVFLCPHSAELATVLTHLLQADAPHASEYQLQQAELAWDRGEAENCVQLTSHALERVDWQAIQRDQELNAALARYVRALLELGRQSEAVDACTRFESLGCRQPVLENVSRRIRDER